MPRAGGKIPVVLTPEEQLRVCRWLGEFIAPARIPALIQQEFGKTVAHQYAYEMLSRQKWQPLIDRYRQDWLVHVLEIPLANKKVRLQALQRLFEQAMRSARTPEAQERRVLRILDRARLEMEEKPSETTYFFGQFNYATASDEELLERRAALVKRIQEFRWPTTRRMTHGMGRSEGGTQTSSETSQDDGGNGQVGHEPFDLSRP